MGFFGSLFGAKEIVEDGLKMIDEAFYTDEEKAQDKLVLLEKKSELKIKQLEAYHPYKKTQRFLALSFVFIYLFIMLNGVVGQLYGVVSIDDVKNALKFANEMWLGEIVLIIITFYFGGGAAEGILEKMKGKR
ncbi:hypothetical protein [Hydrogenimonas thermophila]|uniref:Holin of 3TMs, for gene-transfer release n=1 Tax=Hydrogenimonas thermophila TaxID=223786 RepID=A0A1I5RPT8_9BACT|nr:hypothetical protein [Hydrogenimonas thermophila]SFP60574.1 hypothetical protein SAMN05216234_12814 [Hydrogenimonas thermophila]